MNLPGYTIINGVFHNDRNNIPQQFEERYLAAREKEGRVYDDATVRQLPDVPAGHPLYGEWALRKESAHRLLGYCKKNNPKTILEVGCGNGWLSNMLAGAGDNEVTGADVNLQELEQGARVFPHDNLRFLFDEFTSPLFTDQQFDMIVFAASIQYFPSLKDIVELALSRLTDNGELHILDTHFYPAANIYAAKSRTAAYYASIGVPEMASRYFHHKIEELQQFSHQLLYNPKSLRNKLFSRNRNPFPWACVKKRNGEQ